MKKAICKLKSLTPVTFGKFHQTPKLPKELDGDYERRVFKEKAHYTDDGFVKIPGIMFQLCLSDSAKFLNIQIPGKGKQTYTKHFEAGIIIPGDIITKIHKDDLTGVPIHVPVDGKRGGTKRVIRIFPIVHDWSGEIEVIIGDDIISADVFEQVIRNAGSLIGIGTWRPRNCGRNGKFELVKMKWEE